jgi:hypothetical protein
MASQTSPMLLTNGFPASKLVVGRANGPFLLPPLGWEVVQLVVHQTLDLIILVRVQASQPTFSVFFSKCSCLRSKFPHTLSRRHECQFPR